MNLDFTICTVAAPGRAEVLRQTLESFKLNLYGVDLSDCVCYLNVDGFYSGHKCEDVAASYFNAVCVNRTERSCFPAAVRWLWTQPTGELMFHLEDDWELTSPIDLAVPAELLNNTMRLACVNLRTYGFADGRICLSPGLWRTADARVIAERLTDDEDPELQLRRGAAGAFRGVQFPTTGGAVVRDLGRAWMAQHKLRKNRHAGKRLTAWEST